MSQHKLLQQVLDDNRSRLDANQSWSVGVYFLIGLAMAAQTMMLAIIGAWHLPSRYLGTMPNYWDVRYRTLYLLYPLLLFDFLLTSGAGFSGWLVLTCLYMVVIIILVGVMFCVKERGGETPTSQTQPDGTTVSEQKTLTLEERIRAMYTRHNREKKSELQAILKKFETHEQELLDTCVQKYGPEPDPFLVREGGDVVYLTNLDTLVCFYKKNGRKYEDDHMSIEDEAKELLDKYEGQAEMLFEGLEDKFPEDDYFKMRLPQEPAGWSRAPIPMGKRQSISLIASTMLMLLCFTAIMLSVYLWSSNDYQLVARTGHLPFAPIQSMKEHQEKVAGRTIQLMYSWEGMAMDMSLEFYVKEVTNYCGTKFRKEVAEADRKELIYDQWIDEYSINMTQYDPSDYMQYRSVNSWFVRALAPNMRPLASPNDTSIVVSPADSRMLVFGNISEAKRLWVKGEEFTMKELLDNQKVNEDPNYYIGGSLVIARLAPQDYHRFHSPVTGTIVSIRHVSGTYWSAGADAAQSGNYVFYNQRYIVIIDAGPVLKHVALVAIGATCVGSVTIEKEHGSGGAQGKSVPWEEGETIHKGEQLGMMQFGGSTVIVVFKRGTFLPDCDLTAHSSYPVETYIQVRNRIGKAYVHQQQTAQQNSDTNSTAIQWCTADP